MALLNGQFDASQIQPTDRSLIPPANYKAVIKNSTVNENSNGSGHHLNLEIEIIEGQFAGRKVWENLNCWHASEKTSQIAWATLSAIARAVNVLQFNDTAALHNLPLMVRITQKNGQNAATDFKPIETTGHQPSPGRAYAEGNQPSQPPAPNNYLKQSGQPLTPGEVLAQNKG